MTRVSEGSVIRRADGTLIEDLAGLSNESLFGDAHGPYLWLASLHNVSQTAAWATERAPSFSLARVNAWLTVLGESRNLPEISRLPQPSA
jgi:hypothetical protein